MPLIMCRKCGDAVNDIQVHECLPDMVAGPVMPLPVVSAIPQEISSTLTATPGRSSSEVLDAIRKRIGDKNKPRPMANPCACGHSKYHHDYLMDSSGAWGFANCFNCACQEYALKGGEL